MNRNPVAQSHARAWVIFNHITVGPNSYVDQTVNVQGFDTLLMVYVAAGGVYIRVSSIPEWLHQPVSP